MKRVLIIPVVSSLISLIFAVILIIIWFFRNDVPWECYAVLSGGLMIGLVGIAFSLTGWKRMSRSLSILGAVMAVMSTAPGSSDLFPSLKDGAGDLWAGAGLMGGAVLFIIVFIEISWTLPSLRKEYELKRVVSYLVSLVPVTGAGLIFLAGLFGFVHLVLNGLPERIFNSMEAGSVLLIFVIGLVSLAVLMIVYIFELLVLKLLRA